MADAEGRATAVVSDPAGPFRVVVDYRGPLAVEVAWSSTPGVV
jgi:hypothetical protein